jgi:branched-chain amino acid transport system substrate-binding protein
VKSINDLNPVLDFEVLFVPDFADAGGYLLPTLPFLKIYGVQVVGLSGFHSPKLLERAQDSAEGLIFTDSFFESSQDFKTRLFVNRYEELTGTKPSKIAAEAFDVGAMMISLLRGNSRSAVSREGLRESLSRLSGFDGVTGQMFSEAQQIRKEPQVLTVRNGRFQLLR